ncbi:hypothetical protein, partial [Enterococcus faecalis]|uniref:hypothetical protein n=1 Tax=Enterococcus faecalis TaxID=1351 RepID=UPI003D0A6675
MKQTKWQRLATIGLCSSLVINAFSGVTAVAETITIESSPTVASSAKEATSASSATQASTESSQETTETSREEVTQETEKPEVVKEETQTEAKKQEEETVTSEVVQPNPVLAPTPVSGIGVRAGNLDSFYQLTKTQMLNYSWSTTKVFSVPALKMVFDIKGSGNELVNTNDFKLTAEIRRAIFYNGTGQYSKVISDSTPIITKESGNITIDIPAIELPLEGRTRNYYYLNNINFETPKYIKNIEIKGNLLSFKNQGTTGAFGEIPSDTTIIVTKESENLYSINSAREVYYTGSVWTLGKIPVIFFASTGPDAVYKQFLEFPSENPTVNVDFKKGTESFKDTAGATIPAPTGFTQGKQTSITSNNYTFKQAGTLPETYKASNGKTYKFKGWYKGKTKPNTLTTTKAPSYAVTYDDNDDLNVVYEEVNFPETTYQFGFVNEAGQLVNPEDINLTYDYKSIVFRGTGGAGSTVSFATIANNQSGAKVGNLRQVTLPAKNIAQPTVVGWNGEAFANFSIKLPKYYKSLNLYDKTGKIDPKYPLPVKATVSSASNNAVQSEASVIADLTLTQRADGSFTPRETYSGIDSSVRYPGFLRRTVAYSSSGSTTATHQTISGPVYYHLTNRKVTESFKDTAGATIPAPTGFTQGKQTSITSNNYTFKQAGTLPETYKASNGKTYKFKGWYKGKTKPSTLTTTKAPSYAVTYDDNDDLNVVYEEETVTMLYPTMNVNFVDEKGVGFTPALTFSGKYYAQSTSASLRTDLYDVTSKNNGNGQYTISVNNGSMPLSQELLKKYNNGQPIGITSRLQFNVDKLTIDQQLKYVDSIQVDTAQSRNLKSYRHEHMTDNSLIFDPNVPQSEADLRSEYVDLFRFNSDGTYFSNASNRFFNMHLGYSSTGVNYLLVMILFNANPVNPTKLVYTVTRKQVTENFVDTNGTKITPPTGFTQGNQIPMTSNTFKYTATRALPASYTTGGKTYIFQGWYKGKTKPNTLTTSTTPTYNTTFDGNDDMTAMYKEEVPKASVALTRTT